MANIGIGYSYYSDLATLTAGSAVSTLPVTNLQNSDPARKYRTTGLASQYVQADHGSGNSYAYNCVFFVGANFTNSATLQVRASATDPVAAPALNQSGLDLWPGSKPTKANWAYPIAMASWTNSTAYRFYRFDITDAGNPDGYLEAGRLIACTLWQPASNITPQTPQIGFYSTDPQQRSAHNKLRTARRGYVDRRFDIAFNCLTEADALDGAYEIARLMGFGGDIVFSLDPSHATRFPEFTLYGSFNQVRTNPVPAFSPDGKHVWQFAATIIEKV